MFNWIPFITYTAISAITPGPNNIMCLSNGRMKGFKKAFPFNLGVLVGFTCLSLLCMLFCSFLNELIPKIQFPMTVIGAAYILFLAWKTFRSDGEVKEGDKNYSGFLMGVGVQFINPKAYICTILSLESYILPVYKGQLLILVGFCLIISFAAFAATTCWTAFGSAFKKLFSKHGRIVNTVLALLLVYCAVSLFF